MPAFAEFVRQDLDKMAAIEKALHDQLALGKSIHIFVAALKPKATERGRACILSDL